MELTREYFDTQINKLVTKLVTKEDFDQQISKLATKDELKQALNDQSVELKAFAEEQTESLARIIATTVAEPMEKHFAELKDYGQLKSDVLRIKNRLHMD